MAIDFRKLLVDMGPAKASDLHLKVGGVPIYRINGDIYQANHPPISKEDLTAVVEKILPATLKEAFQKDGAVDFGFSLDMNTRFRTNVYLQRGSLSIALRRLQSEHLSFEQLQLPAVVEQLAKSKRGMLLVTGPTGTGKSTTMAAVIDHINTNYRRHIITIEDPIEFMFKDKQSFIDQREIGLDCRSFDQALRHGMREDPDVILIGEMRDKETVSIAIRAAMTGHLVISTLHTINSVQTVTRILKYFPAEEQAGLKSELGIAIRGVISQRLIPSADGKGRVPCVEIMVINDMIRKLIREDRVEDMIQIIKNRMDGMQSFDQSLLELYQKKLITFEIGMEYAEDQSGFKRMSEGGFAGGDRAALLSGF